MDQWGDTKSDMKWDMRWVRVMALFLAVGIAPMNNISLGVSQISMNDFKEQVTRVSRNPLEKIPSEEIIDISFKEIQSRHEEFFRNSVLTAVSR